MEIIAYISIAYLAVRILIALVNLASGQYLKTAEPQEFPLISVLIPARNEEGNIGTLLDDLQMLDYGNVEILVYDDDSNDRTAALILERSKNDLRIRYLHGSGPLPGWLGKNYACDQLARQAAGDYLLFLDADVRVNPGLLSDSLACMQKLDLSLLSIFPEQVMKTLGESMTVPLMNRILVGNLPLILIRKSRMSDFAAANGQFMMFKADAYRKYWFHEQFKDEKVEDIRIIRKMKKFDYRVHTLLSGGQISCRMYRGYQEGIAGFSKNIHAFFGKNWLVLLLYNILTTLGPIAAWLAFSFRIMLAYLFALILFSVLVSVQSRQPVLKNLIFLPFQQFSVLLISMMAAYRQLTGRLSWKGRKIS